jgi:hypothetical protein
MDPGEDIESIVNGLAAGYVGAELRVDLVEGWRQADLAVRSFPPLSIYTHYGVVWQRLLTRPLVPDIGRIPVEDRAYYERFMCTSVHNPNRVDLAQDVLFELLTPEYARAAVERIDENVWEPLDKALALFEEAEDKASQAGNPKAQMVFQDQAVRMKALRCLFETLRATALWIHAVHTYLKSGDEAERSRLRDILDDMIAREIRNCRALKELWENSGIEWMIVSGSEETPFIYAEHWGELLDRKIRLMEEYGACEPRIDPEYMFQVRGNPYAGND